MSTTGGYRLQVTCRRGAARRQVRGEARRSVRAEMGRRELPLLLPMLLLLLMLMLPPPLLAAALPDVDHNQVEAPVAGPESCRPGEVFRRACNLCLCPDSGVRGRAACTDRPCLPPLPPKRRFRRAPGNGERCAPNIRYMDDCNLCICSADGIKAHSSCTFAQCPGKPR